MPRFKTQCLDGAPWSRVALEVLRTSRERSCLRPFDADEMAPLALMIRPPDSSPPSFQRARSGAGVLSGFQAFAVGSHHFVGALDFQPRLAATIRLAEPVAVIRRQLVVLAAPRHQHEDNARDLVGERDRSQLERMRESCKSGSVGEAVGDRRLYPTASNPV
jgi:hypothetical protein